MPIVTRLTNTGTLLVNGSFDENTSIAPSKFRTTANTVQASLLDEITINGGPVAKRENSDGTLQVSDIFDEFTGAPVVDSSLKAWLDAGQTASYSGSGNTWTDLSGNSNNYTLRNSPTYSATTGGGAITFAGASSQYANSTSTLFNSNTYEPYTMNLWVYPTGAGQLVQVNGQSSINTGYHYSAIEISEPGGARTYADSAYTSQGWTGATDYTGATGTFVYSCALGVQSASGGARTVSLLTGAYYFEFVISAIGTGTAKVVGLARNSSSGGYNNVPGINSFNGARIGGLIGSNLTAFAVGDVIQIAYNSSTNKFFMGQNNVWNEDPSTGTGTSIPGTGNINLFIICGSSSTATMSGTFRNVSQNTYTAPSGYSPYPSGVGSSEINFGQWNGSTITTIGTSVQYLNAWYNLVITYDGTTATAYVNNTNVGNVNIGWSEPGANTFFSLMATSSQNMGTQGYASGSIGAFMVYNRNLTADEVTTNFNALRNRYGV
jgi:hypothetical protein